MCVHHNPLLDDDRIHGGQTLGAFSITSSATDRADHPSNTETSGHRIFMLPAEAPPCHAPVPVPEGRVHGGNIAAMFANGLSFGEKSTNYTEASTSALHNFKPANQLEPSTSCRGNWL
jgi:hypothetical protein